MSTLTVLQTLLFVWLCSYLLFLIFLHVCTAPGWDTLMTVPWEQCCSKCLHVTWTPGHSTPGTWLWSWTLAPGPAPGTQSLWSPMMWVAWDLGTWSLCPDHCWSPLTTVSSSTKSRKYFIITSENTSSGDVMMMQHQIFMQSSNSDQCYDYVRRVLQCGEYNRKINYSPHQHQLPSISTENFIIRFCSACSAELQN